MMTEPPLLTLSSPSVSLSSALPQEEQMDFSGSCLSWPSRAPTDLVSVMSTKGLSPSSQTLAFISKDTAQVSPC